jgi:transcriptional regulator with PAS, ATPase and Fis domain
MHEAARRVLGRDGELVAVSCANLSGGLFESELFGYRRGAFTGAERDFEGLLGRAAGGTIVFDEVQALAAADQARLLRLLGEREYRAVGDDETKETDALVVLASNRNLREMVRDGTFRRDLLDRALAKISIPPLFERRKDIGDLAQAFAVEAAAQLGAASHYGLTRRARADIETAVVRAREVSVRRLREIVRNAVFMAASGRLPEAFESELLLPVLESELAFDTAHRDEQDVVELHREFDMLVGKARLREIADGHDVSLRALDALCRGVHALIDDMHGQDRSYRNVVERTNRLSKVALWLISGAQTQAEFRRYFGKLDGDMPTKSVAHQIFHQVFGKGANQ